MKKPIERHLFVIKSKGRNITIELFKMEDSTYTAYAFKNFDREGEIVGVGKADEINTAVKFAIHDLLIEISNNF